METIFRLVKIVNTYHFFDKFDLKQFYKKISKNI